MSKNFQKEELIELLNSYLTRKKMFSNKELDTIIPKLKNIDSIVKNVILDLYVSEESFTSDKCEILATKNDKEIYLYLQLLLKSNIKTVKVQCKILTATNIQDNKLFNSIIFINEYLDKNTFRQTKFNEIFINWKAVVKQVRKSAFNTLFPTRIKNLTFIPYNKSNTKIIQLKDISKPYLDLKDKHITIKCPICNKKYLIDKNNFEKMFIVKDNKCFLNCDHTGSKFL